MDKFRQQIIIQQEQKLDQRLAILRLIKDRAPIQKVINRLRVGTLRAKWLNKLEQEEDLGILTKFIEQYTKGYNKAVIKRYFFMDRLYILTKLYQKWYKQRGNDKQEDFYIWLNKKVILD